MWQGGKCPSTDDSGRTKQGDFKGPAAVFVCFDAATWNNNSCRITKGEDRMLKTEEELPLNFVVEGCVFSGLVSARLK